MKIAGRFVGIACLVLACAGGPAPADAPPADESRPPMGTHQKHRLTLARRRAHAAIPAPPQPVSGGPESGFAGGPSVGLLSIVVSDPGPDGNADGWIQPGEIVTLQISLTNFGNSPANGLFGTLQPGESNPYVTILDKTADWPSIAAHGTGSSNAPHFLVQVSNTLPCGYPVELILALQATGYATTIPIRLDLSRPYSFDLVADTTRRYNEADSLVYGAGSSDDAGESIATGDVNGDGFDDVIVGASAGDGPGESRNLAGEVWVLYGSSEGILPALDTATPPASAIVIYGPDVNDRLGQAVAAGDLNGDGFDDLILGAPDGDGSGNAKTDSGEVWIVYGQAASLPATIDLASPPSNAKVIWAPDSFDSLGDAVAAGDVNGDGIDDAIVGAAASGGFLNNEVLAGEVWVVHGRSTQLPPTTDLGTLLSYVSVVFGANSGDFLGTAVAAGDFDGDGIDDLLLGAPGSDGVDAQRISSGDAWIVYGRAGGIALATNLANDPEDTKRIIGPEVGDNLGDAVGAGDVNGDGFDDVVAGAFVGDGTANAKISAGEVWLLLGGPARLPATDDLFSPPANASVVYGADAGDQLGFSVATGDVDGDGFDDVVAGAVEADASGNAKAGAGDAWVIRGRAAQLPASVDLATPPANARVFYGADVDDALGTAVATGDVDGDGLAELLLGAQEGDAAGNGRSGAGEVALVRGIPTTTYWNKSETFAFVDASAGTDLGLVCDDCSVGVPIGFAFPYYGEKLTTVYVSSNGFVSFAPINDLVSSNVRCIHAKSPTSLSSQPLLAAPLWDDLDLRTSGSVRMLLSGTAPDRRLTIEWIAVPHYPNTGAATFEVSLYESTGQILFQYQDVDFGNAAYNFGASASVGVQNRTAAEGTPYACNTAALASSQAISFNPSTPLFTDNMESIDTAGNKPGKWTMAGGSTSQWHSQTGLFCTPNFHGRTRSLYEGNGTTCAYASNIAGDTLNLPQVAGFPADARLSYWERFQGVGANDAGRLEIQGNGGGYTTLSTSTNGSGSWQYAPPRFLNANAGQTVDLRYRFSSDPFGNAIGWMLDDVRLTGCNAKGIASFALAAAFAQPPLYCGDGSHSGRLDAVGSFCGDGSQPTGYQWNEESAPISGANGVAYTVPAGHAAGAFDFSVTVTCAGGSATSASQEVEIVAPPASVGSTLLLGLQNGKADLHFSWGDVGGASSYLVFQDGAANGPFSTTTGTASSGASGLTVPTPAAPLVFYLVAGSNPTCGAGPKN